MNRPSFAGSPRNLRFCASAPTSIAKPITQSAPPAAATHPSGSCRVEVIAASPQETVRKIEETKARGGRVWAVGTTTVRALEFGAKKTGRLTTTEGWCDLYIYPGFTFRVIDNLITNFHLPDSSLMFLVSALCGRKTLLNCYEEAIREDYHFFSYGDAMAIVTA